MAKRPGLLGVFLIMYILFLASHLGVFMIRKYGREQYERGKVAGMLIYFKKVKEIKMIDKKKIDSCYKFLDDVSKEMNKILIGETAKKLYRAFMIGLIAPVPYKLKGGVEERTGCGHVWLEAVPGTGKTLAAKERKTEKAYSDIYRYLLKGIFVLCLLIIILYI